MIASGFWCLTTILETDCIEHDFPVYWHFYHLDTARVVLALNYMHSSRCSILASRTNMKKKKSAQYLNNVCMMSVDGHGKRRLF
jgi:hypothetical protein